MMAGETHDLVVIGAGPGGYVAAIRAAQLGWNVGCIDKEEMLGGTCLRIGCIPSKALLESSALYWQAKSEMEAHGIRLQSVDLDLRAMMQRKERAVRTLSKGVEHLFKINRITRYQGHGRITAPGRVRVDGEGTATELTARHILIATGSRADTLPGIELDGDRIATSTEALAYPEVPNHLVVIGAGAVGLELGSVWRRLGAEVTVLEYLDRILPGMDREISDEAMKSLEKQGMKFHLESRVTGAGVKNGRCVVESEGAEALICDRVLVATGRKPFTEGLGLEEVGVERDPSGFISVDEGFATSVPGVFAVGDVIRGPMLAHKAEEEGTACVERLISSYGRVDYRTVPGVVYTEPEVASVGETEEQLEEQGADYKKGTFPFRANGRAHTLGHTQGTVKVLADAKTDRVLGVHIFGPRAGDLIAEATAAIAFGASSEDLARTCHAHPTLPEALREAALAVSGRAIHS